MADVTNDPPRDSRGGALVRTFLLADLRGYTRYTRDHGDEAASELARRFADLVRATVPAFDGELLEVRGDETLCVFSSARQALRAAIEVQRRLRAPVHGDPFPVGVGMGLDAGEAVPTDGGYRGAALNMAGRLVAIAGPGEVQATERLVELTGQIEGLRWSAPKRVRLRGLDRPERVVRVDSVEPLPAPPPAQSSRPPARRRGWVYLAGGVLIAAVGVAIVIATSRSSPPRALSIATPPRSLAVISPSTRRVVKDFALPTQPESLVAGAGTVWVGGAADTVTPIAFGGKRAGSPIPVGVDPTWLAFGHGAVWAFDGVQRLGEIDAGHRTSLGSVRVWRCTSTDVTTSLPHCAAGGVAVVGNEVWVSLDQFARGPIQRLSASNRAPLGRIPNVAVGPLATGQGVVWAATGTDVDFVSTKRTHLVTPISLSQTVTGGSLTVAFGYAWYAPPLGGLWRCSDTSVSCTLFQIAPSPTGITASANALWVSTASGHVFEYRPNHLTLIHAYKLGSTSATAIVYAGGKIWVALAHR